MSYYSRDIPGSPGSPESLEQRYSQLVDVVVSLEHQLNDVDQVLTAFYFSRITLSSIQPVLDLARKRIKVQVRAGRDILGEERRS